MSEGIVAANPSTSSDDIVFGFVKITVRDLDRVTHFYRGLLGLRVTRTVELPGYTEVVLRPPGLETGTCLILYRRDDDRELAIGDGWGPLGFYVPDVDACYLQATALGGRQGRAPYDVGDLHVAFVYDPEGHQVELVGRKT